MSKIFKCKKCDSERYNLVSQGPHAGLYCAECGLWHKWLARDEFLCYEQTLKHRTIKNHLIERRDSLLKLMALCNARIEKAKTEEEINRQNTQLFEQEIRYAEICQVIDVLDFIMED